jgi:hypothetical protein
VIQDLSNQRPRTIPDAVRRLLFDLASITGPYVQDSQVQDEDADEDEDEDEDLGYFYDDMDSIFDPSVSKSVHLDAERLQQ